MRLNFAARQAIVALLAVAGGAFGLAQPTKAVAPMALPQAEVTQDSLAQAQRPTMTWRSFVTFMTSESDEIYMSMLPQSFPNGFANGQVAVTAMHTGYSSYIVAREGVAIPNLSTIRQQVGNNISFNTLGGEPGVGGIYDLPAVSSFPTHQYSGSNVIEVVAWAARYDDATLRDRARRSRQQMLPNGQRAYYMAPDNDRIGWCTFQDEREQYSHYLCVNIANSPQTAFGVLSLIVSNPINPYY